MPALNPPHRLAFCYTLKPQERFSRFQAEALEAMAWPGLHLPSCQEASPTEPFLTLQATLTGRQRLMSLFQNPSTSAGHSQPSSAFHPPMGETVSSAAKQLHLILKVTEHLAALEHKLEQTHLLPLNLYVQPECLFYLEEDADQSNLQSFDPTRLELFYLPLWVDAHEPESAHGLGVSGLGPQQGRLGYYGWLLESLENCAVQLSLDLKRTGLEAADQGLSQLFRWIQQHLLPILANGSPELRALVPLVSNAQTTINPPVRVRALASQEPASKGPERDAISAEKNILPECLLKQDRPPLLSKSSASSGLKKPNRPTFRLLACVLASQGLFILLCLQLTARYIAFQIGYSRYLPWIALGIFATLDAYLMTLLWPRKASRPSRTDTEPLRKPPADDTALTGLSLSLSEATEEPSTQRLTGANPGYFSRCIPGTREETAQDRTYVLHSPFNLGTHPLTCDLVVRGDPLREPIAQVIQNGNQTELEIMKPQFITLNGQTFLKPTRCPLPERATLKVLDEVYYYQGRLAYAQPNQPSRSSRRPSVRLA